MSRQINLMDFPFQDAHQQFAAALEEAKKQPGTTVLVPPGEYILTSELARKTMASAIGGLYGENPEDTMFSPAFEFTEGISFKGHQGTVLLAYGAKIMVDGFMEPLCLKNCSGITLKGLTIDHLRKPYSRGMIESYDISDEKTGQGSILVRFLDQFPVDENTIMPRYCAYDFSSGRFNLDMKVIKRAYEGHQVFRFTMKNMPAKSLAGQEFYVWHSFHYRPAILVEDAKDITLRDITIHSQPGMGIVGHRSENILMDGLKVVPSQGEQMSTNTDATHFTSCKGYVTFQNCVFDGHGDDATNVHTFYHDIALINPTTYKGSVTMPTHSLTLDYPNVGDQLELVDQKSLELLDCYQVTAVTPDFAGLSYTAQLNKPLPAMTEDSCWLANISQMPALTFANSTANNHWARSVLIKTRNVLVENCTFTNSVLYAIHVAAEAWWHEGVACENVTIRNNRFVNCGISGHAQVGGIKVEMSVPEPKGTPQRNILIENNIFDLPQVNHAIHVSNGENITIKGNRFLDVKEPLHVVACENVVECENVVIKK